MSLKPWTKKQIDRFKVTTSEKKKSTTFSDNHSERLIRSTAVHHAASPTFLCVCYFFRPQLLLITHLYIPLLLSVCVRESACVCVLSFRTTGSSALPPSQARSVPNHIASLIKLFLGSKTKSQHHRVIITSLFSPSQHPSPSLLCLGTLETYAASVHSIT